MKQHVILTAVLIAICITPRLSAEKSRPDTLIRGVRFLPSATRLVAETIHIDIPRSCLRTDSVHAKEKYPITFFTAGCNGASPCLTLSIMVMVIPESIRGFDEVVDRSLKEDFGAGDPRKINEALIVSPCSGADRVSLYYGPSFVAGNHIIGYYHSHEKKSTSKVVIGLTFIDSFSDGEWQAVLVHSVNILKSVRFPK
jgi:hypothetical protein